MKRSFIYFYRTALSILAVTGMLFSCAKQLAPVDPDAPTGDSELVDVVFMVSDDSDTKVTGISEANEKKVDRYTVFAFDSESNWVTYKTSSAGENVTLTVRSGRNYRCYALVNYPVSGAGSLNPAGVTSESDLTGKVAYLSDNSASSLLMYGMETVSVSPVVYDPEADPSTIVPESKTIHVHRLVSRIDVPKVAVDFTGKSYFDGKTFVLTGIYLTNLYRTTKYGSDYTYSELSSTRSAWYNGGGWHLGDVPDAAIDALVGDRGLNVTLTKASPYTVSHSFYAFPNACPVGSDEHQMGVWRKRCTRIVIEATLDGETMYYQVNVPSMEHNRIYAVNNVVITGRGSNNPEEIDIDPLDQNISFEVVVQDSWETPVNVTENS